MKSYGTILGGNSGGHLAPVEPLRRKFDDKRLRRGIRVHVMRYLRHYHVSCWEDANPVLAMDTFGGEGRLVWWERADEPDPTHKGRNWYGHFDSVGEVHTFLGKVLKESGPRHRLRDYYGMRSPRFWNGRGERIE